MFSIVCNAFGITIIRVSVDGSTQAMNKTVRIIILDVNNRVLRANFVVQRYVRRASKWLVNVRLQIETQQIMENLSAAPFLQLLDLFEQLFADRVQRLVNVRGGEHLDR